MNQILRPTAPILFALALAIAPAAQALTQDDILAASILPGWQTGSGSHMAALRLTLAPDWKTYWRSPGDTGIPPMFDWSQSENLKSVHLHWPSPDVFHTNGLQSIGYHDQLVLPLEVTAIDPGQPVLLRGRVDLGVCKDICMPAALDLSADLNSPGAPDAEIGAALNQRPLTAKEAGLSGIRCSVAPIADGLRITATIGLPAPAHPETVVFEAGQPGIWVSQAVTERSGGTLTSVTEMVAPSGVPFALNRSAVVVTVLAGGGAVEITGCPAE